MIERVVTFVDADLPLCLEALPAIEDPVICWIVVVGIVIEVTGWHVVLHGYEGTE